MSTRPPPLAIYEEPCPTRRLRLTRPVEVNGALVSHVIVRPVTTAELAAKREGKVSADELVAICAGLPARAGVRLSDVDHARLVELIADLNGEAHETILAARRARFRIVGGPE